MDYKNEKHRIAFEEAIRKKDRKKYTLLSALYLLTADCQLWRLVRHCVMNNAICFEQIRLHETSTSGYALFCAAKDLYCDTKNFTVSDLADADIIPPKIFGLICNAMAIRRFGLGAIHFNEEGTKKHDQSSH